MEVGIDALKEAIENTHGGKARFLEAVPISEVFQGNPVWQGVVHVFELIGNPTALKCYAWSSSVEGTNKRRFYTVLHSPPINSPIDAVRMTIIKEYREDKKHI